MKLPEHITLESRRFPAGAPFSIPRGGVKAPSSRDATPRKSVEDPKGMNGMSFEELLKSLGIEQAEIE